MDNIKEFKVNGTAYGLNLSEIGAVINDGGTQKELKQYIDSHSGGGGGGTSSKVVRINPHWYDNPENYQSEIKKALEDIYNEVSNNRTVTVTTTGYFSQSDSVFETTNVVAMNKNEVMVFCIKEWGNQIFVLWLHYDEGNDFYYLSLSENNLATKSSLYLPYVYTDGQIDIDTNDGRIAEFISEPTVNNEEFVVIKTTVKAYTGTDSPNNEIYTAMRDDNGYNYLLSKFGGMRLWQRGDNANFDLLPDGDWYVIFGDIAAATYVRCIVTKAVRNVDGTLDVYLGFKGYDIDSLSFWDCTVDNRDNQGDEGKWNERNWVKVSDAENISVDSFIGRRTRYFCVNTEGTKVDRLVLFKRMK